MLDPLKTGEKGFKENGEEEKHIFSHFSCEIFSIIYQKALVKLKKPNNFLFYFGWNGKNENNNNNKKLD